MTCLYVMTHRIDGATYKIYIEFQKNSHSFIFFQNKQVGYKLWHFRMTKHLRTFFKINISCRSGFQKIPTDPLSVSSHTVWNIFLKTIPKCEVSVKQNIYRYYPMNVCLLHSILFCDTNIHYIEIVTLYTFKALSLQILTRERVSVII